MFRNKVIALAILWGLGGCSDESPSASEPVESPSSDRTLDDLNGTAPAGMVVAASGARQVQSNGYYHWVVYVGGQPDTVSAIKFVQYTLDQSFPNRDRGVTQSIVNGFATDGYAWASGANLTVFYVDIMVKFADGHTQTLRQPVELRDGTEPRRECTLAELRFAQASCHLYDANSQGVDWCYADPLLATDSHGTNPYWRCTP
jgi:hypothetical protein